MRFPKLELASLRIMEYSDASFPENHDLYSQLSYILLLQDNHDVAMPVFFNSYKARRVCRSAMTAGTIDFFNLFDQAVTLRRQLASLLDRDVPMKLFTDSKSLFDYI